MSFAERLHAGEFPLALEITPPKSSRPDVLLRRARLAGGLPAAINVIQRPDRQSSLEASLELVAEGFAPAWHLVTRGRTRDAIAGDLALAAAGGVAQILAIRGDHAADGDVKSVTIREAITLAREIAPTAALGATLNQYQPDRAAVLRNLLPKLKAGATYVQTQPVFDVDDLKPLVEQVKAVAPETRVVAMAMPLETLAAADRVAQLVGTPLPDVVRRRITSGADCWESFEELLCRLVESPLIDGVAIMTYEMDPDAVAVGARIVEAARNAGIR